jgi:hypothetical protein
MGLVGNNFLATLYLDYQLIYPAEFRLNRIFRADNIRVQLSNSTVLGKISGLYARFIQAHAPFAKLCDLPSSWVPCQADFKLVAVNFYELEENQDHMRTILVLKGKVTIQYI